MASGDFRKMDPLAAVIMIKAIALMHVLWSHSPVPGVRARRTGVDAIDLAAARARGSACHRVPIDREAIVNHQRNIDEHLARLAEEATLNRTALADDLRGEIRLLARTVALSRGETPASGEG